MIYNKGYDVYVNINYSGGIDIIYHGETLPQYIGSKKGKNHPYPLVDVPNHGEALVHRLVYYAFNGYHDPSYVIDHEDNNPFNNHIFNLRLVNRSDNALARKTQQPRSEENMRKWFKHWVDTNYTVYNKDPLE